MATEHFDNRRKIEKFTIYSAVIRSFHLASTFINLIATPIVFIHYSNIHNFGLWTLILSVGSLAAILDLGLVQVMTTASIQATAKDKTEEASEILNNLLNFLIYLVITIFLALMTLNIAFGRVWEISQYEFLQSASLCFFNFSLGILVRYFEGAFRAQRNLFGLKLLVLSSYLDITIILSNTIEGASFNAILLEMIATKIIVNLILAFRFQKKSKIYKFISLKRAILGISPYQKMGMSILGMPLGYLVINEASNVAVASILGLEMLGIFALLKSLGGIFRQVSGIFILSMTPKFTKLITKKKLDIARQSFSNLKTFLIAVNSIILIALLSIFNLISRNISKMESVGFFEYTIFLSSAFLDIWWIIDSSILVAVNQHKGLTFRFLLSAALGFLIGCSFLFTFGVSAMAIGTLAIDLVLIPYSLEKKNKILKADFIES